jgi:5-methyltetrahydrofolate--homocysteine methyltransferase
MLNVLISEGRPLLADGATGTNLFEAGLASGETPELWNDTHPEKIRALIQSFVDAGSDIVLANSFGGNRRRLMLHGLQDRVRELNRVAAEIARDVADKSGRRVVVGGSLGPTGDLLAPLGPLTEDEGLKDGGADVVWIETMSAPDEIRAAARAAQALGVPYVATASFDTAGRTMMGLSPDAYAELFESFETPPLAFGANCGVGASDLLVSVLGMTAKRPEAVVVAKANAGVPQWHGAHIHYSGTPELMADYARLAVNAGARIVGGCCGNKPAHVAAMRRALDEYTPGERPTMESIVAALGPLVSPPAQEGGGRVRRRAREAT